MVELDVMNVHHVVMKRMQKIGYFSPRVTLMSVHILMSTIHGSYAHSNYSKHAHARVKNNKIIVWRERILCAHVAEVDRNKEPLLAA